jgi:hypothetical protein
MESCRDDTIGGFNTFLTDQKALGGSLTLVQFDHEYIVTNSKTPIGEFPALSRETYKPRGSTALLDAIGQTIKKWDGGTTPSVVILTDGLENASTKFTKAHIKDLIKQKTKDGWTFAYLGANQDAFAEAGSIGIAPGCTMNYETTSTPDAFRRLSAAVSSQASGASQAVTF